MAVIPGGTTKYIQAPDLSWNRPFKQSIQEQHTEWISEEANMSRTPAGNLRAAPRSLVVQWIKNAWNSLSKELIINSFKSCGLTTNVNGEEDDQIHCMKVGEPCRGAWSILQDFRDNNLDSVIQPIIEEETPEIFLIDESDEEEGEGEEDDEDTGSEKEDEDETMHEDVVWTSDDED